MLDSQQYPWYLYLINNVEDIEAWKLKIIIFQKQKHWYLDLTWSDQDYKGESGIVIFLWRVTWNYAYCPFKRALKVKEFFL